MGNKQKQRWIDSNKRQGLLLVVMAGTTLVALLIGLSIGRSGRFFEALNALLQMRSAPQVDVRPLVIHQVQSASELTTAVLAMETVVPTRQDRTVGGYVIGTTTLLYIAYGEVRAGVDLSQLRTSDVEVQSNTIRIRLPPPRILDSKIDVNRSKVYDYSRGFLALGPDVAPQLQTLAEQETLKRIVTKACNQGLLKAANDRAQMVVSQLLNGSGYKQVQVETTLPPSDCGQSGTTGK